MIREGVHIEFCGILRLNFQIPQKKFHKIPYELFKPNFSLYIVVFSRSFTSMSPRSPTKQRKKQCAAK